MEALTLALISPSPKELITAPGLCVLIRSQESSFLKLILYHLLTILCVL